MARPLLVALGLGSLVAAACTTIASLTPVPVPVDAGVDTGGDDGGDASSPFCEAGATQCLGNVVQSCGPGGLWADGGADGAGLTACTNQTCLGGACVGVCGPGQTQCDMTGKLVQTCDTSGMWPPGGYPCASGQCSSGICVGKTTDGTSCKGSGGGVSTCGPSGNESCCTSLEVPGGTFYRSYDGVTMGFMTKGSPATVSGLRVDRFEVTVGRFRQYVQAVLAGGDAGPPAIPAQGSGKHAHLNGGQGLNDSAGGFETGWGGPSGANPPWNNFLSPTNNGWDQCKIAGSTCDLQCNSMDPLRATWTPKPGNPTNNETLPINCVNWYEAYAFCIWDGGFLPSEAEWNYIAAGGSEQRVYPWSGNPGTMATTLNCSVANYFALCPKSCPSGTSGECADAVGLRSPMGDGKWGQADLGGNLYEWTRDWFASSGKYAVPCNDCSDTLGTDSLGLQVRRGGSFNDMAGLNLSASQRSSLPPNAPIPQSIMGFRCARVP